jgi:hypothetical protein
LNNKAILSLPADRIEDEISNSPEVLPVSQTVSKDAAVLRVSSGLYQSLAFLVRATRLRFFRSIRFIRCFWPTSSCRSPAASRPGREERGRYAGRFPDGPPDRVAV